MPLPQPAPALVKTLSAITVLAGLMYAGHAWMNQDEPALAKPANPSAAPALNLPPSPIQAASPRAGQLDAREIAQAYARAPQEADARFKGQRLRFQGVVEQTEAGQGRVLLITLGGAEGHAGLRAVVDMAQQPDPATKPVAGQALSLECLNQGLLMGEPVLSDCRLLP